VKLEEEVVVLGVDDMNFGLSGSERLWTLTVDEVGKGKGGMYLGLRLVAASCPGLKRRRWPCRVYSLRIPHLCRGDTLGGRLPLPHMVRERFHCHVTIYAVILAWRAHFPFCHPSEMASRLCVFNGLKIERQE